MVDLKGVYVVTVGDDDRDAQPYTYRVTGERLEQLRNNPRVVVYYKGTEAAYGAAAAGNPHYDYAGIEPLWVEPPTAVELSNTNDENLPF